MNSYNSINKSLRGAITLVEILVVIGIVCLLMGLILPAVQRSRDSASRVSCQNNLRQISVGLHSYHSHFNHLPPSRSGSLYDRDADALLSWMALILPYMDQDVLWKASETACKSEILPYKNPPHIGYSTVIKNYICPSDSRLFSPLMSANSGSAAFTSYIGVSGGGSGSKVSSLGAFSKSPGYRFDAIRDGTSNTLLIGERPPPESLQAGRWYQSSYILEQFGGPDGQMFVNGPIVSPQDMECSSAGTKFGPGIISNPCDRMHFWSLHVGGANFALCDGSVRYMPYSASSLMIALATCEGGEAVELP